MAGSFSYNAGSNTVTVTGGTSGSPADFASFVAADRAGTLNVQDARNITGADGSPVAATRALRPVERLVLGGPAHTLYLVITNWNGTDAIIRIVGTDYDGNAQQEDIDISGNGTLYTVKRYATITSTQVTALNGTGFTYTLTQAGWGVIWDKGNQQYQLDCKWQVGDGSTSTYFDGSSRSLFFSLSNAYVTIWTTKANSTTVFGTVVDEANKVTGMRGQILVSWGPYFSFNDGTIYLYGYELYCTYAQFKSCRIWNCIVTGTAVIQSSSADLFNVIFANSTLRSENVNGAVPVASPFLVGATLYCGNLVYLTVDNPVIVGSVTCNMTWVTSPYYCAVIDANAWFSSITWGGTCTGVLKRQYSFNVHVTDKDGNNISGATVTLKDNGGNTVFSVSTGVDGKIAKQIVDRGYYDQAHGSVLQDYGPFTLSITQTGYRDYQDIITLDRKMDLEVALLATAAGGGVSPTNLGLVPLGVKQVAV
jgi:hypothetical protein